MQKQILGVAIALSLSVFGCTLSHSDATRNELQETVAKKSAEAKTLTLTNGKWTITIGNRAAWSGVNGTGDATYRGCATQGSCIDLAGGKTSCRDGICVTKWQNDGYSYSVEEIMDMPDSPRDVGSRTSLVVRKGDEEILRTSGFRAIAP